ncbi:uncharacterized protein [Henckelia pumila]|uniref:uncharacterized protein n=1 Tax=Henckelia pumila TaxID=405737 RepID=UPI003C6DD5DF
MVQNTVQFGAMTIDDPYAHLKNFLEICDTFKKQGVSDDAICLRLFPFSLRDKAKAWLTNLPAGSITTWDDLAKAFLTKYFPPSKSMKLRADITTFAQGEQETLYEAWERYKDLLRRCPHHELPDGLVVQTFYYGLPHSNCTMLDAVASVNLLHKSPEDGYELIEDMAYSSYHSQSDRNAARRSAGIHQVDAFTSVAAQLENTSRNIVKLEIHHINQREACLKKAKLDSQLAKFLEVFKKLNINISFADALMQMPSYAKFLKEILSNKRKLEEHAMISLTENCSALVQNKIPPKQKDPGSFSIPCVINDVQFHKSLCDLGASINLMSYSVFRKLSLGEPKSTRMSLQLADRSIKYPRGIIEDVLVKVDKFIFSMDFVVLDMEEDLDATYSGKNFPGNRKNTNRCPKGRNTSESGRG